MIRFLTDLVIRTYRNPRAGLRDVMNMVKGYEGAALLFMLSFSINTGLVIVMGLFLGQGGAGLGYLISNLIFSVIAYAIGVLLVFQIGRAFGGKGTAAEVAVMMSWHSVVTVIFAPLVAAATFEELAHGAPAFITFGQLAMVGVVLWLLTQFVAETHGFKSALRVAGVIFGCVFAVAFLFSLVLQGAMSG